MAKYIIGVLTFWPIIYFFLFIAFFFSFIFGSRLGSSNSEFPPVFLYFFIIHFLTIIISIGLLIFYIIHLFKNKKMPQDKKALWAIVLFMGGFIAMPIYWWIYIRKS